jgi:hypothetical protein
MNFDIIGGNSSEAADELAEIRSRVASGALTVEEFQIRLLHAYHHLNFAWNIKYVATST